MVDAKVSPKKSMATPKKWYTSKQLWTNFFALLALLAQERFGYVLPPVFEAVALIVANFILRIITKQPVDWHINWHIDFDKTIPRLFCLILCLMVLAGCATPLKKACDELTRVQAKLSKAVIIAQVANEKDPNLVSEGNIKELIYLRDSITNFAGMVCTLDAKVSGE